MTRLASKSPLYTVSCQDFAEPLAVCVAPCLARPRSTFCGWVSPQGGDWLTSSPTSFLHVATLFMSSGTSAERDLALALKAWICCSFSAISACAWAARVTSGWDGTCAMATLKAKLRLHKSP